MGGVPIIYMGDELCQQDDRTWPADPERRADSRWAHRPAFDDALLPDRDDPSTPTGRVWSGLRRLVATRRACPPLHDDGASVAVFDAGSSAVFAWHRSHPRFGDLIGLANVGAETFDVVRHPVVADGAIDLLAPGDPGLWRLAPLQVRWITADARYATVPAPGGGAPTNGIGSGSAA